MRALGSSVIVFASAALIACSGDATDASEPDPPQLLSGSLPPSSSSGGKDTSAQPGKTTAPKPPASTNPAVDASTLTHPEVVYLIMAGKDGLTWFCTAALVSPTVAVTAAHCLQSKLFLSWEILAPTVANRPRVKVVTPRMYDTSWNDVAHPDIGMVELESPITLSQYAELTDVTDRAGSLEVSTIVRKAELPEAPFQKAGALKLSSTAKYGYEYGYGVPLYSHGGDSGAGMFLLENGQMTHKLVAVEREPDPARKIDHLTRVDAEFISWVAGN